jgi:hypothetical protein
MPAVVKRIAEEMTAELSQQNPPINFAALASDFDMDPVNPVGHAPPSFRMACYFALKEPLAKVIHDKYLKMATSGAQQDPTASSGRSDSQSRCC